MFTVTSHTQSWCSSWGLVLAFPRRRGGWRGPRNGIKVTHRHWIKNLPFPLYVRRSQHPGQRPSERLRRSAWSCTCAHLWPYNDHNSQFTVALHGLVDSKNRPFALTHQSQLNTLWKCQTDSVPFLTSFLCWQASVKDLDIVFYVFAAFKELFHFWLFSFSK